MQKSQKLISDTDLVAVLECFKKSMLSGVCPLYYTNAYTMLVAIMLSARAMDRFINTVTPGLFSVADDPEKMIALGYGGLCDHIKRIGLWRNKAKNIISMSHILILKHSGVVPDTFDELTALPGVGRKTADVLLNYWFGRETIPVDTHVFRVAQRIGIAYANTPEKLAKKLYIRVPEQYHKMLSHWLVMHGRGPCKAIRPACNSCQVSTWCLHKQNNHSF